MPSQSSETSKMITGTSTPKLSVTVQKLRSVLAELQKDTEGLKEYDQLLVSRSSLQNELERKNRELEVKSRGIAEVNERMKVLNMQLNRKTEEDTSFKNQLLQAYEERYSGWEKERERHSKDAEELSQLKQNLRTTHKMAEHLSSTNGELQNQLNELRNQHSGTQKQLDKCQSEVVSLKNQNQMKSLQLQEAQSQLQKSEGSVANLRNELGVLPLNAILL